MNGKADSGLRIAESRSSDSATPYKVASQENGWRAKLELEFLSREGTTFLAKRRHAGPLLVQRPFHPEGGVCHTYIVHPPGGVVGGDELMLEIDAQVGSHALLTTPAAAKFYRSAGAVARQTQTLRASDAVIEWLPQENIYYPASHVRSATIVNLVGDSQFIGWEIACLGLPARGESFDTGELRLHFELWADRAPLLIDRLRISGADRRNAWSLAGHEAIGTLLAYPASRDCVESIRSLEVNGAEFSVTLVDDVLVCRCLAAQAEPIKRAFVAAWRLLRPMMLQREAMEPRIWAT